MKKILFVLFIVLVLMLTGNASASDLFGHMPKSIDENEGKAMEISIDDVIISHSYSNYAWSRVDYGELVLNNGKRYLYTCEFTDKKECVYKSNGSIKDKDLKKIKKYGKTLNDKKIKTSNVANDAGENSIVYRKDGIGITLKGRGDNKVDNKSSEAKKILKILKKYKIYI